jgi:hypothetical protein
MYLIQCGFRDCVTEWSTVLLLGRRVFRISYNAIGDQEDADGVARTFACACWLLSDVAQERNCRFFDCKLWSNDVAQT